MGETGSAASAASTAGSAASGAGSAAGAASTAGSAASTAGNAYQAGAMANLGNGLNSTLGASSAGQAAGYGGSMAGGFGVEPASSGTAMSYTPSSTDFGGSGEWDANTVSSIDKANQSLDRWNTTNPDFWQQGYDTYDRFSKGMNNDLPTAWKNRGNNPETYGYVYGKMSNLSGGGGGPAVPNSNMTVITQQGEKQEMYPSRRRRYY